MRRLDGHSRSEILLNLIYNIPLQYKLLKSLVKIIIGTTIASVLVLIHRIRIEETWRIIVTD